MQQGSEMRRSARVAGPQSDRQGGAPGLWSAAAMAVLSAVVCWIWLMSSAASNTGQTSGEAVPSELAQVDGRDLAAALTTMNGSDAFLAQFKQRAGGCPQPLAWVSVAQTSGQPPGQVRLRSGNYISPTFSLSEVPVRVAIPYPGPYETGHGRLTALDAGGSATIALLPAWRVPARDGGATREVTWHATRHCVPPNE
jgi:hypothetical protein